MRERYVAKRVINLLLLFLITAGFTAALCQLQGLYADELTGYLFLAFMFFVLFVYVLEYSRAEGKIADNRETDYSKISAGFFASALIILISVRLPEFLKPVILVALIMTALGSQMIAVCTGLFLCALMCLAGGGSAQEMVLCCLMLLFGCMLELTAERAHLRYWCAAIVFALAVMLPGIFYYLAYREVKLSLFLFGAVEGAVEVIFLLLVITQLAAAKHAEGSGLFADILDESYPMARELLKFSRTEYRHARRVSHAAAKCAEIVGADRNVCAAAGFYYRIGIIEGEPLVESGIRIARKECFPEGVIGVISEYNGELALPSTTESAIVHMVDGLIKKLEVLDSQTMSSEWNQDMVIYQTLNDFSAMGMYDKSGLSMNMFLKIREYLVKEEKLLL